MDTQDEGKPRRRGKKQRQADDAEMTRRVDVCIEVLERGGTIHDIEAASKEGGWGVSRRQLTTYQSRAMEWLHEYYMALRERRIAVHMARREEMFRLAMKAGEIRTALDVEQDAAKLEGLYPATKADVSLGVRNIADGPPPEDLTDAELAAHKAEVARALRELGPGPEEAGGGEE